MITTNKILIPYDFGEAAQKALTYAISFAANNANGVLTVGFINAAGTSQSPEATFEEIRSELPKTFKASLTYTQILPADVSGVLAESKRTNTDLIIMGTGGSEDPQGITHTSQTVLESHCPVLVIPKSVSEDFKIERMALVLGPQEIGDPKVLEMLLHIARTFDARVRVLTIENKPGTYGYSEGEERNESLLEYYLEGFYAHHVFLENADVANGIFEYAQEKEIDLISILPRNHVQKGTPSEGRLTRLLTLRSNTPLLTIPG